MASDPNVRVFKERRLNFLLLAAIVLPTLLLGAGISQLHSFQISRNSHALVAQAERAESNGDLARAQDCLRQFLEFHPNHAEALVKYGLIRAARDRTVDDRKQTIRAFQRALRVDPDRSDIRRRLVGLAMSVKSFAVAETNLKTLLGRRSPTEIDPVRRIEARGRRARVPAGTMCGGRKALHVGRRLVQECDRAFFPADRRVRQTG